jgi:hypothetical protein
MTLKVGPHYPRAKAAPMKRLPVPLEEDEQITLMAWCDRHERLYPELALLYHVPNSGKRHVNYAAKMKRLGLKSGVPDLCLPVQRGGYPGLYVELKRRRSGNVSASQAAWHARLRAEGYRVEVALGWEQARDALLAYLNLTAE